MPQEIIREGEKKQESKEIIEAVMEVKKYQQKDIKKEIDLGEEGDKFIGEGIKILNGKIEWSLKSPSEMFSKFYHQKNMFLKKCVVGGQVEYSRWMEELEEAEVDVVTEVFDQQVIIKQMEKVQQCRNRVKYIGVRVNNQYYLFDRFIGLLRGYLARIEYLKPVLKQDGLILEHMGDIEMYFERLKALHNSVSITEKNLAASYEMLSRKVTICMELPPIERYERPSLSEHKSKFINKNKENLDGLEDFDDLPENAKAGPKEKNSGSIGWNEI